MSTAGFSQGEGQRAILTTGFACSEVCGMLSIWEGTYGGTIPGIPNWFGLAAVMQTGRKGKKEEKKNKEKTQTFMKMLTIWHKCYPFYPFASMV